MAEAKLVTWLMWTLGGGFYGYTLYVNLASWKSDIMFAVAIVGILVRGYFYIRRRTREDRKAEQEEQLRDIDISDRKALQDERKRNQQQNRKN